MKGNTVFPRKARNEDGKEDNHWTIETAHSDGRIHITPKHANELFPVCWNREAAMSLYMALQKFFEENGYI